MNSDSADNLFAGLFWALFLLVALLAVCKVTGVLAVGWWLILGSLVLPLVCLLGCVVVIAIADLIAFWRANGR